MSLTIYTQLQNRVGKANPVGDGYLYYDEVIVDDKTGLEKVKKVRVPVYKIIQENRKTTDMSYILEQLKKGDMSVLERTKGVYVDTTELPGSLEEAMLFDEKIAGVYKDNKLLRMIYKNVDDYKKDLFSGVNIAQKVVDKTNEIIKASQKKVQSKVEPQPKVEPKKE